MSTENIIKLDSPYKRLGYVFEHESDGFTQDFANLVKKVAGEHQYCSLGFAGNKAGLPMERSIWKDLALKINIFKTSPDEKNGFEDILPAYGFSQKEINKIKECPEPNCFVHTDLDGLISHVNDRHKVPFKQMGRIIREFEFAKEPEKLTTGDYFYLIRRSVQQVFKFP